MDSVCVVLNPIVIVLLQRSNAERILCYDPLVQHFGQVVKVYEWTFTTEDGIPYRKTLRLREQVYGLLFEHIRFFPYPNKQAKSVTEQGKQVKE